MIVLGIQIERRDVIRGLSRRHSGIVKETLQETGKFWHDNQLQKHFGPRNKSEYQFEDRTKIYSEQIKTREGVGVGKFRLEVLTGKAQRQLTYLFSISGTAKRVVVKMTPEAYFTRPFVGSFTDPKTGKQKKITRQPDKPSEVTRISEQDRKELMLHAQTTYWRKIQDSTPAPTTTTIP